MAGQVQAPSLIWPVAAGQLLPRLEGVGRLVTKEHVSVPLRAVAGEVQRQPQAVRRLDVGHVGPGKSRFDGDPNREGEGGVGGPFLELQRQPAVSYPRAFVTRPGPRGPENQSVLTWKTHTLLGLAFVPAGLLQSKRSSCNKSRTGNADGLPRRQRLSRVTVETEGHGRDSRRLHTLNDTTNVFAALLLILEARFRQMGTTQSSCTHTILPAVSEGLNSHHGLTVITCLPSDLPGCQGLEMLCTADVGGSGWEQVQIQAGSSKPLEDCYN